jgi:hypothetical protein
VRAERDALQCALGLNRAGERKEEGVECTLEFEEFGSGREKLKIE